MKKLMLFAFFLLSCMNLLAQQIEGRVTNKKQHPIEFATIVLQTVDSVYEDVAYSDSLGYFRFDSPLANYRILVQHLGYQSFEGMFATHQVGAITLETQEHELTEVLVTGERPLVQVIEGRMTYDMPRLLEGKVVSSVYDALLHLPGVYEQQEVLTLAGAPSLHIILNGQLTTLSYSQLMQLLKSIPKERVEKAEIMYAAPPQYHVRGAAINILLNGGQTETPTLQGQVNGGYKQSHYANYNAGLTLLYTKPKLSMDLLYAFGANKTRTGLDLDSKHTLADKIYPIEQFNQGYSNEMTHTLRLGTDFNLNEKNQLSVAYTTQLSPSGKAYEASKGTFSQSTNTKRKTAGKPQQMHNFMVNYTSGFGLKTGADYTFFQSHTTQYYEEMMTGKENQFEAYSKQDINRLSMYADQKFALGKNWTLNFGGRFMYASDRSSQRYHSLSGKDMTTSDSESNLDEYTYDFYAGFAKSFSEKLSLSASLTGEYYKYNELDEWSVFPVMELTYLARPEHIFQLSLSTDKVYPSYWDLMNSVGYLNGYAEIHGNPLLKPYKNYSLQLNYILKGKYVLTGYMNYQDDYFEQLPYQSPERLALLYKTTNYKYGLMAGVNLVVPFRVGKVLDSRLMVNGFYKKVESNRFHGTSFLNDRWAVYGHLMNTINVSSKPDIKIELSGWYHSKPIQGPMVMSEVYSVDAGIKWTFLKDAGELRLKANDLFNRGSTPKLLDMSYDKQNLRMRMHPDGRFVSVSFTYKFGGYKEKKRQEVDTSRFGNK